MSRKPLPTLADAAAAAIGPVLIMLLVGSLCFFLLEVFTQGRASEMHRWVLGWFVIGIVLIGRMSIQLGSAQALAYGAMLALATAFVLWSFAACLLLAIVWWCAHKLTWDCTVIDERADASGEGLLDAAGVPLDKPTERDAAEAKPEDLPKKTTRPKSPLDRFLDWMNSEDKRPHSPGVWVLYFSLAALPLFGFGEWFIPAQAKIARDNAFQNLFIYTASALALLVTTSFLGLRRYLRQRKVEMPPEIAASWIGVGAAIVIAVLVACLLVPRPQSETSITAWLDRQAQGPKKEASDYAVVKTDAGEGQGRALAEGSTPADQPQNQSGSSSNQANSQQGATSQQNSGQTPSSQASNNAGNKPGKNQGGSSKGSSGSSKGSQSNEPSKNQSGDKSTDPSSSNQNEAKNANEPGSQSPSDASNSPNREGQPNSEQSPDSPTKNENESSNDQSDRSSGSSGSSAENGEQGANQTPPPTPDHAPPKGATPPNQSALSKGLGDAVRFLALLVKWAIYGLIALAALAGLFIYGSDILEALAKMWSDLLAWWAGLMGSPPKAKGKQVEEPGPVLPKYAPFSAYRDPFVTGEASRLDTPRLLAYTFEASQAWARERGLAERADRTPSEFAGEAARMFPEAGAELPGLAQVYAAMLYGARTPPETVRPALERLWRRMAMRETVGAV